MNKKPALTLVDPKAEAEKLKQRFDELIKKTNKSSPNEKDVDALRQLMQDNPDQKLHQEMLGIMGLAEAYILQEGSPLGRSGLNEVLREKQKDVRRDLGYDDAPEMEKFLISHVALCWLRLGLLEISYTRVMAQSQSITLSTFWEKRLTAAQRRYTRACETLATVQRLARSTPALHLLKTGTG